MPVARVRHYVQEAWAHQHPSEKVAEDRLYVESQEPDMAGRPIGRGLEQPEA